MGINALKEVTNIQLFNGVAGRLFALLYEKFPFYTDVDFATLGAELVDKSGCDGAWDITELAEATVHWLAAAGYIWLKEPDVLSTPYTAVLSPKGFEVLKAMPEAIDTGKTLGEKIAELSKSGVSTGLSKVVDFPMSQGIKLMMGS